MFIGIRPDYRIIIREDLLNEIDGPMLQHGLKGLHLTKLSIPRRVDLRPNPEHLVQRNGELYSYGRLNEYYRYSFPNNTPEQVWQKFIRKNDQIFMVLSGHNFDWASDTGETLRVDLNEAGHPVYQFCIDYQYRNSLYSEP